jgi:enediyne biosynthesis protein E4
MNQATPILLAVAAVAAGCGHISLSKAEQASTRKPSVQFSEISRLAGVQGPAEMGGHGTAVADVNGDGLEDVYVTTSSLGKPTPNFLFINKGDGTFREAAKSAGVSGDKQRDDLSHGAIFVDFDHDGDFDLFLGTGDPVMDNRLFQNDGQGRFTEVTASSGLGRSPFGTRAVCAGDLNGDGFIDLYVSNALGPNYFDYDGPPVDVENVYLSDGKGRWRREKRGLLYTGFTQGALICDIDNDGDLDVIEAKWGHRGEKITVSIMLNDGTGFFQDATAALGLNPQGFPLNGIDVGDYDNDGYLDLVMIGDALRLYRNERGKGFTDVTEKVGIAGRSCRGFSAVFGDVDNDGYLDLFVANTDGVPFVLYRNDGRGSLRRSEATGLELKDDGGASSRAAAFLDFNNDGALDLFIARKRDFNLLFRNEHRRQDWLKVKLIGVHGDAGAIGTKVWIYAAGHLGDEGHLKGYRQAINSRAYLVQHSPLLHFGLGESRQADVRVQFPGGKVVKYRKVAAGHVLLVDGRGDGRGRGNAQGMRSPPEAFFGIASACPRHFQYQSKPFFFVGKSAFALIDAEDRRRFVDEAHRDGFNVLRIWLCCPSLTKKHGDDHFRRNQAAGDLWPFDATPEKPDFTRFNEDYFRRLDAILQHMQSEGMVAQLTLFTGGDFWPGGPHAWDAVKQGYVQFVLDRYRDRPNLYYEIANEYYSPEGQAFVEKVGDFIWEQDKLHLVTASAGDVARFADKPWYRLHQMHASRGRNWWRRVYDELLPLATRHRLPAVNDEPMGSQAPDDKEQGYPGRDTDPVHHRMNFWMTAMSGSYVTFHSHKGINALVGPSPGQEFVRPFREFFEQTWFWEFEPAPEKVRAGTACVLASATELVAYLPEGGPVILDLRGFEGACTARWFNPRDGKFGDQSAVRGGGRQEFQSPDRNDRVVQLTKRRE